MRNLAGDFGGRGVSTAEAARISGGVDVGRWLGAPDLGGRGGSDGDPAGNFEALAATRVERVRAEPFEAVEISVGVLFGEEEPEE